MIVGAVLVLVAAALLPRLLGKEAPVVARPPGDVYRSLGDASTTVLADGNTYDDWGEAVESGSAELVAVDAEGNAVLTPQVLFDVSTTVRRGGSGGADGGGGPGPGGDGGGNPGGPGATTTTTGAGGPTQPTRTVPTTPTTPTTEEPPPPDAPPFCLAAFNLKQRLKSSVLDAEASDPDHAVLLGVTNLVLEHAGVIDEYEQTAPVELSAPVAQVIDWLHRTAEIGRGAAPGLEPPPLDPVIPADGAVGAWLAGNCT